MNNYPAPYLQEVSPLDRHMLYNTIQYERAFDLLVALLGTIC